MSDHHCWYVIGRKLRLAIAYALFASLFIANPAFAAESTGTAALEPVAEGVASELSNIVQTVASQKVAEPLGAPETEPSEEKDEVTDPSSHLETKTLEQAQADLYAFEDDETYDLILAVRRKGEIISQEIIGFQKGFTYYLPVRGFAQVIKFPTEANLAQGTVSGTFFNNQNTYSVDANRGTFTVRGETFDLPEGSYFIKDLGQNIGDIYVTPEIINQLWPIDAEIDFSELAIIIKTVKLLPYELEIERKKRQDRLEGREGEDAGPQFEFIPNNYKLLGKPIFNISEATSWSEDNSKFLSSINVSGRGDVFGTSADYTTNTIYDSEEGYDLTNARLRLTRQNLGDGSLPFGLKMVQLGDVAAKPSPLISKFFSGRGAYLSTSTRPTNQRFDEITVDGTAQPGWETELYRGTQLIDFGFVDETGRYQFDNIPLNFGKNEIKVVLYGPQGQIEEQVKTYQIKRTQLRPGETTYEASVLDLGRPLIDVRENKPKKFKNSTKFIRVNRGLTHWLTGFATLTRTPEPNTTEDNTFVTLGGEFNALGGTGQVELYKEADGGTVYDARFSTQFAGINTGFRSTFLNDFESTEASFGQNRKTFEGEFRAAKSFNLGFGSLGLNLDTRHTRRANDTRTTRSGFSQSLSTNGFGASNAFSTNHIDGKHQTSDGTFSVNTHISNQWKLRSSLDYNIHPKADLELSRFDLSYDDNNKFSASLEARQGLKEEGTTQLGVSANYDFDKFLGSADVDWDSDIGFDLMLRASTTLGPDAEDGSYIFTTSYKGHNTALKIRLFHDKDSDGEYGEGDEPVEGGKVFVNQNKTTPSDSNGIIELLGAGPPGLVNVRVDQESLPNPFLTSIKEGYSTVLRLRSKPFIDFALIDTGSIDGVIRFEDGAPIPGLIVQLVSSDGLVLQEVPTLSDGFYVFEFVRPGIYIVQVSASHQINVPPKTVSVTSEEIFAYGVDLTLLEQAEEVSATKEADGGSGRVAHTYHNAPVADGTLQPAPYPSDDGFQPVVSAVRIGEHPYKVRLVLDLSGPSDYKITSENGGDIINIDLPSTAWDADRYHDLSKHPIFEKCEVLGIDGGTGSRLRLHARSPIETFYNTAIPPEKGRGHRIYADFLKIK